MIILKDNTQLKLHPYFSSKLCPPSPPLLSRRVQIDQKTNSVLTLLNKPINSYRCQTPGPHIARADSKGRPISPLRVKKNNEEKLSPRKPETREQSKKFQYLASLFIEKLVAVPTTSRKQGEVLDKRLKSKKRRIKRACCIDKSPQNHTFYEPKATMTELRDSKQNEYFFPTDSSDIIIIPKLYNSDKKGL